MPCKNNCTVCIEHSNNLQTHIDSQIRYNILNSSLTLLFRINNTSGEIRVVRNIDFEVTQMFILRVQASDSGTPIRSATHDYTMNITNMNDNSLQFAAPAYLPVRLAMRLVPGI